MPRPPKKTPTNDRPFPFSTSIVYVRQALLKRQYVAIQELVPRKLDGWRPLKTDNSYCFTFREGESHWSLVEYLNAQGIKYFVEVTLATKSHWLPNWSHH